MGSNKLILGESFLLQARAVKLFEKDMNLKKYLYKVTKRIAVIQDSSFKVPVKEQKKFLESLKEPEDLIERSYNQYLCQRWLKNRAVNILTDIGCIPLMVYYWCKKGEKSLNTEHAKAVYLGMGGGNDNIPRELSEIYSDILNIPKVDECLSKRDKIIIKNLLRRYPLSFEFCLKCLIKVRMYSWVIDMYSPDAIIVSGEYSYTSSFLTYYCRKNGIKHINIMHGEKGYYIRDSFFEFDKCYIWDSYYMDLFSRLRAPSSQFVIAVPPSLTLKGTYTKKYDYTYYLSSESRKRLRRILELLMKLESLGYKVAIRPHPRYSEMMLINKIFKGKVDIENPKEVEISESILRTWNVVSLHSTVINQAVNSGINAVIDDVSDVERYNLLYELEYRFVADKNILLVSEIVGLNE